MVRRSLIWTIASANETASYPLIAAFVFGMLNKYRDLVDARVTQQNESEMSKRMYAIAKTK